VSPHSKKRSAAAATLYHWRFWPVHVSCLHHRSRMEHRT
jgi:hypothetical protein